MKKRVTKVDFLKSSIMGDIQAGIYHPGDDLPSIRELCERYKMSKQTVSLALADLNKNGILDVSHGRSTRIIGKSKAKKIELIYSSKTSIESQEFWREFYFGIKDELNGRHNYDLELIQIGTEAERLSTERLTSPLTCGAILCGSNYYDSMWKYIHQRNIPLVKVYDIKSNLPQNQAQVTSNFHEAMTEIVRKFIIGGRKQIAFMGISLKESRYFIDHEKYECFVKVLDENGIIFDPTYHLTVPSIDIEKSYEPFLAMLRSGRQPDAVFLSSDLLAPGIYRAAFESGLTIPQDLAVAGCDDLAIGRLLVPSLTTINQRRYEMGRCALRQLMKMIEGNTTTSHEIIPAQLINRESSPSPRPIPWNIRNAKVKSTSNV